jgi:exodeoxyribonuclease VII large subunit
MLAVHARAKLAIAAVLDNRFARLERAERLLAAVSYRGVLARGFALVRDDAGRPVRTAAMVQRGTRLDIEFSDGRVRATAEATAVAAPPVTPKRRRRGGGGEGQGSLFGT